VLARSIPDGLELEGALLDLEPPSQPGSAARMARFLAVALMAAAKSATV
jgi:hypothetical protein